MNNRLLESQVRAPASGIGFIMGFAWVLTMGLLVLALGPAGLTIGVAFNFFVTLLPSGLDSSMSTSNHYQGAKPKLNFGKEGAS